MHEDDLISLFQTLNIETGKLNPRVIQAWFDTDCNNLLEWICNSITENCYVSPQENTEYAEIDILTTDQLNKNIRAFETRYPDILEIESNLLDIEIARDTIETLEEQLRHCDHQISVNKQLHQNLLTELSEASDKNIKLHLEEESAYNTCLKLSQELDNINKETHDQIMKYSFHLNNFELEFPEFVNNMDIANIEEKFSDTAHSLSAIIKVESDFFETSMSKHVTDTLVELENRIFHSRISQLTLQMEVEAFNSVLNFFENYDVNTALSLKDYDSLLVSTGVSKDQQCWMLKVIEETSSKLAGHYVNQPAVQSLKCEHEFFQLKLNYLNKLQQSLYYMLLHFVNVHGLYLQEKTDINSSSKFFRNVQKYVKKELKDSNFRKKTMLTLISQYEDFCLLPIEHKLKLVNAFGTIVLNSNDLSIRDIVEKSTELRSKTQKMKQQHCHMLSSDLKCLENVHTNIKVLEEFLISGPTSQIVTIPTLLQNLLYKVDENMEKQKLTIKLLIKASQTSKEHFAKDKWLHYRNLLWFYFMVNHVKLIYMVDQLKKNEKIDEAMIV